MGADDTVHIDIEIDPAEFKKDPLLPEVRKLLSVIRPDWTKEKIKPKVFTDGISNQLVGYYEDGKFDKDVVLLRVYGVGTELMIDRKTEIDNIQLLNKAGCCPPLYATVTNGLAYGFVYGCTLDADTVRDDHIKRLIAKELCRLHMVRQDKQEKVESKLFTKLRRFLELSPEKFDDPQKHKRYLATIRPKPELIRECDILQTHLESLNCPVVFCHNDLLLKNLIHSKAEDRIFFIDHEYAMYNYQQYDVGNHFCEYAGIDNLDFKRYPDKAYQLDWIKFYLQNWAEANNGSASDVTDKDVEIFYVQVNKFALAAHLFWGLWALVQSKYSKIDFDFLDYAKLKLDEYFARKDEFLALEIPQ